MSKWHNTQDNGKYLIPSEKWEGVKIYMYLIMVNKASKNNHFISFYLPKTNFFLQKLLEISNYLAKIISIIPTSKQARSKSEADKKTKCSL